MQLMSPRKWIAAVLLSVAAAMPAQAETTVTFMGWVNMFDFQKPGWARIIENFGKAHPDIKISYIGSNRPLGAALRRLG
jgi:ABC-type glycerol-3-phosphate transport system substrate-binding protein